LSSRISRRSGRRVLIGSSRRTALPQVLESESEDWDWGEGLPGRAPVQDVRERGCPMVGKKIGVAKG